MLLCFAIRTLKLNAEQKVSLSLVHVNIVKTYQTCKWRCSLVSGTPNFSYRRRVDDMTGWAIRLNKILWNVHVLLFNSLTTYLVVKYEQLVSESERLRLKKLEELSKNVDSIHWWWLYIEPNAVNLLGLCDVFKVSSLYLYKGVFGFDVFYGCLFLLEFDGVFQLI